jgi:hypothetical protein
MNDKEKKIKSLEIKKNVKKEFKNINNPVTKKNFDIWKVIIKEFSRNLDADDFVVGNNAWGENMLRNHQYFYKKFFKDFGGSKLDRKNEVIFTDKIFKLLKNSVNKTPQKTTVRKLPFKQLGGDLEYALPGHQTIYSNNNKSKNHYHYSFCNKTKIDFFKGDKTQEQQIIKNKWDKLYSYSFIYGYLQASVSAILKLGNFKFISDDPKDIFSNRKSKFTKDKNRELKYDEEYTKNLIQSFYKKYFKTKNSFETKIFNDIEKSIYESNLSKLLYFKSENYFTYNTKDIFSDENDGINDFIFEIGKRKIKYLGGSKDKRFLKVFNDTKKDQKNKIFPYESNGTIINFEQFRLYTLSLPFQKPFDSKELKIEEKDIFIRYAVNMGVQEILFYIIEMIFSRAYLK